MKFSLCIGAYRGQSLMHHLRKVKEHGFHGLEYYHWWTIEDPEEAFRFKQEEGVGIVSTCTRFFDLVRPQHRDTFIGGLEETISFCTKWDIPVIITQTGNERDDVSRDVQQQAMVETLKHAADRCERAGVTLVVEPLNGLVDHPGHFLQYSGEGADIIDRVGSDRVKLLFDVYHQQITEGNVIRNLTQYIDRIHHIHIADNPGRKQPGTGELHYGNILAKIRELGYEGVVGLECGFTKNTDEALHELKPLFDLKC